MIGILGVADLVKDRIRCFSVRYWSSIRWLNISQVDGIACQDDSTATM